jgi:methionine-rich copper-binding protein CopC
MLDMQRVARNGAHLRVVAFRRVLAPALALAALALTTTSALALTGVVQPKPQLSVEAERSPQGARLTFKGKNWAPSARVKLTGTRAPGANGAQDFGTYSADSTGVLSARKIVGCTTNNMDDAQTADVTVTATDSASGAKATARVQGGAWVCQ